MVDELENLSEQLNAANVFVDENVQNGRGQNIAIYHGDETLTYRDVLESVNKTGNALKNIGVNTEERVMLILLDSPEFVASFFRSNKDWRSSHSHQYHAESERLSILLK